MARIAKKLVDSNTSVAEGGRADRYWKGRTVKRSGRYSTGRLDFNVDQHEIIRKFSLKGFEYGNWLNNNDRYDRLLAAADSLTDLAGIIGSKNIGMDGHAGIAFGARGSSRASAHFEPSTWMINLTKEHGAGALAHEYGHALDYFFGMYIDPSKGSASLSGGASTRKYVKPESGKIRILVNRTVNALCASESYSVWEKAGSEYWIRRNEIFARAFEMWTALQCRERNISNSFLSKMKYRSGMYPSKNDFTKIVPLMDRMIREMAVHLNRK